MEKLRETISTYEAREGLATYINRIETFLDTDFITSVENKFKYQEYLGEMDETV